jgi:hypothetical protein
MQAIATPTGSLRSCGTELLRLVNLKQLKKKSTTKTKVAETGLRAELAYYLDYLDCDSPQVTLQVK